jgi:hypothetical protein
MSYTLDDQALEEQEEQNAGSTASVDIAKSCPHAD